MVELFIVLLLGYLLIKAFALTFKIAWGAAKAIAVLLSILALPVLIVGLLLVGGVFLLVPFGMVALAIGLLKSCT